MRNILAIARRELAATFATPVGWISVAFWLLITGYFFSTLVLLYVQQSVDMGFNPYGGMDLDVNEYLIAPLFANCDIILLMICPAITMRLFSEDRKTRAMELLLSSPISTTEIVLGKFLGGLGVVAVLLLCTSHYVGALLYFGNPDPGVIAGAMLAVLLLGAAFVSVGLLASSLTDNQIVAFITGFGLLLLLWVLGWGESIAGGVMKEVLSFASLMNRMDDMTKGLIHLRDVGFFGSFTAFFLFATHQRVEAYRWS